MTPTRTEVLRYAAVLAVAACGGKSAPVASPPVGPTTIGAADVSAPVKPPLARGTTIGCRWVDVARFTSVLGEAAPLSVKDENKKDGDAASRCALVRGGEPLDEAEQAQLRKTGKLGVLPGDAVCTVSAYCWTIETPESFAQRCAARGGRDDVSVAPHACVQRLVQGADDVHTFDIVDDDSRCVLTVHGGPGNVDNAQIQRCATTAVELFGAAAVATP